MPFSNIGLAKLAANAKDVASSNIPNPYVTKSSIIVPVIIAPDTAHALIMFIIQYYHLYICLIVCLLVLHIYYSKV